MKLRQKISSLGLKSAKFQFAIVREDEVWKIFAIRVVLENIQEYGKKTLENKLDHRWSPWDRYTYEYDQIQSLRLS